MNGNEWWSNELTNTIRRFQLLLQSENKFIFEYSTNVNTTTKSDTNSKKRGTLKMGEKAIRIGDIERMF